MKTETSMDGETSEACVKKEETLELNIYSYGDDLDNPPGGVSVKVEDPDDKDYLYCEVCKSFFLNKCEVHGPPLFIPDTPVPMGVPDRARQTLPPGLEIQKSSIPYADLGVFNKGETVPVGAHFGPCQGELVNREEAKNSGDSSVEMAKTAAERQMAYRQRKKNDEGFQRKERERKRLERLKKKSTQTLLEANIEREKAKKRQQRRRMRLKTCQTVPSQQSPVYKSRQSFGKAMKRVINALPSSPRKRSAIVHTLSVKLDFHCEKKRTSSTLTTEFTTAVVEFYKRDDISRQAPGKKDVVIIRVEGKKNKIQKRHMTMSLMEAYRLFKEDHPEVTVGKSKFAELRPPFVLLRSDTPKNVCLCKYHENTSLLLNCAYKHLPRMAFKSVSNYVDAVVCSSGSVACMLNECDECGEGRKFLQLISNIPEEEKDTNTSWYVWESVEGVQVKTQKVGLFRDVLQMLLQTAPRFIRHAFIKQQQSRFFEGKKKEGNKGCVVLQVDFAENYSVGYQDEIQSAHWNQSQITIFTAVAWVNEEVQSYVIVSDELQHDKNAVTAFLTTLVKDLEVRFPEMQKLHIFSDGSASQFKNRFVWFFLASTFMEIFPAITAEWHYFATGHGKGAVDGVGGTVKRAVGTAVLSREVVVANAENFAETAKKVCPKMEVLFVRQEEIKAFCTTHEVGRYWELVTPLPGTLNVHSVSPVAWGQVQHKPYSIATTTAEHTLVQLDPGSNDEETSDEEGEVGITTGDCVLVEFEGKKSRRVYVGLVTDLDDNMAEIQFLRRNDELGLVYIMPIKEDKSWVTRDQVIRRLNPLVDNRGRHHFSEAVQAE
ncbi:uncharacterized protein LOC132865864 isoform X2 [Neoarius graeffei]|nr:uncharacterized protein LOC132865864 isoform X2 [Neoarius graeffei]